MDLSKYLIVHYENDSSKSKQANIQPVLQIQPI
jgi:hypothetical protein